ncbi:MAG: 30S ribosomal protein S12 methylthiotransferase RimO [Candidatus Magnetoovum sp. WYHC-5]|nr:30S ribosomal protein S12 methylthiotransferase RimO [Candidatus Magnetoovum sp. WYHC-5]
MSKVFITTLGCPKNEADSNHLLDLLVKEGIYHTDNPAEASLILVNTCGFINDAKEESIEEILRFIELRASGQRILVFGCLAKRYKEELMKEIPEIDALWGIGDEQLIVQYCKNHVKAINKKSPLVPMSFNSQPYEYLKIADGCNRHCTFCIIPKIKGHFKSEHPDNILKKAQNAIIAGKKELILVAQDLTSYGSDNGYSLERLIDDIASISGDFWLRLMYLYPLSVDELLLQKIKTEDKVCKYLDIPLQHSKDKILRAMGRGINNDYINFLTNIRKEIPDVVLRTAFIVGFPGEEEDDFMGLLDFIQEIQFDRLGVFAYSREEGTKAFKMKPVLPRYVIKHRIDRLMELQADISYKKNIAYVNKSFKALIDEKDSAGNTFARLYSHAPDVDGCVFIENVSNNVTGEFVNVKITNAHTYDLIGEVYTKTN